MIDECSHPVQGLLAVARAAARAGAETLQRRPGPLTPLRADQLGAENKTSTSDWVTDYDRGAEHAVRSVVIAYRPHDEITGEEYDQHVPESPSGYRWSIDPLDGTTNFIRGIPHYATSVAVGYHADEGQAVQWLAGVVHAPALGCTWYAARGAGAYLVREADVPAGEAGQHPEPLRLSGPASQQQGRLLGTGFSYDRQRRPYQIAAANRLMEHEGFADIRRLGSAAIDLCLVAQGTLDAYAEYGLSEYDWAAGALIGEEAGLSVRRPRWSNGVETGDWCLLGELGPTGNSLGLEPGHRCHY
ncbi:inositol monophosphatase family protein [Auritidibacter ignavus]|uniref:inositol monophosphatase family protein n=1 Tax=Auritidibacter ignavus TaxID=678932 RepID=UPI002FE54C71